jgi:hypothetical protein
VEPPLRSPAGLIGCGQGSSSRGGLIPACKDPIAALAPCLESPDLCGKKPASCSSNHPKGHSDARPLSTTKSTSGQRDSFVERHYLGNRIHKVTQMLRPRLVLARPRPKFAATGLHSDLLPRALDTRGMQRNNVTGHFDNRTSQGAAVPRCTKRAASICWHATCSAS